MKDLFAELRVLLSFPQNVILLLARFAIAYGFSVPALMKIQNMEGTRIWFQEIGIPFAGFITYLVSAVETTGIVLLILGLFTRYISILLACVMVGAMFFVHLQHGYSVANNGIEITLYYFIFLSVFITFGPGKYSLDELLFKRGRYEQ